LHCAIEVAYIFASVEAITVKFLVWENTTRKKPHPLELTSKVTTEFACDVSTGVGRIFPGGAVGDFPKNFSRGSKSGEICFLPLEIERKTFLLIISKSRVSLGPPSLPSDAHDNGTSRGLHN